MNKYFGIFRLATFAVVLTTIASCSDDEPGQKYLIAEEKIQTRTASELQTFINASPINIDPSLFRYDIEVYRISYVTTYKDEKIRASGLVVLPKTTAQVGMLSFQHGTIAAHSDAPSETPTNSPALVLYGAIGASGFIGVIPDFIGFGDSKDIFHPYYVEEATADAVIDALKAARELARKKNVRFNENLFLAGYSQGGYATMAAHKYIEENGLNNFDLVASFPSSGGYDVKGMQEYFFSQTTYHEPFYLAYVALAYQTYYEWTNTLQEFFNEPYASRIQIIFNGISDGGDINAQLTTNVSALVKSDLIANIDTNPDYAFLVDAFNENSLLDWTPTIPMYMYHGDADITVPYENSVSVYNHFIANGASQSVVTFTPLPGEDHGSGIYPYLEHLIEKVTDLQ
jgi:pimeloyl-ACP methyl ester carboxylesterase